MTRWIEYNVNILFILGLVVAADLLLLAVVGVITVPVLLSGRRMTRGGGGAFVAAYAGYLLWLILY